MATKSEVVFLELNPLARQLTVVQDGLYRTDESLMLHDRASPNELCLYDVGGIVPYGIASPPDPDETMCLTDIARGTKGVGKIRIWPKWLNARNIVLAFVVLLIAYHYFK